MMRRLILFLLPVISCLACAPRPVYRMNPTDQQVEYDQGVAYVHRRQGGLEMTISYYQHMGNAFAMDVEIANRTDSVLRVLPSQFSYDAYGGYQGRAPSDSTPVWSSRGAINPEKKLLEKDKAIARSIAHQKTSALIYGIGQTANVAADIATDDPRQSESIREDEANYSVQHAVNQQEERNKRHGLVDQRQIWEIDAIRTTDLQPGEYIRGYVFFKNQANAHGYMIHYDDGPVNLSAFFKQQKFSAKRQSNYQ